MFIYLPHDLLLIVMYIWVSFFFKFVCLLFCFCFHLFCSHGIILHLVHWYYFLAHVISFLCLHYKYIDVAMQISFRSFVVIKYRVMNTFYLLK